MILCQVCHHMNNGESQCSVCNSININRKLINDWNKQFPQLKDTMNNKVNSLCKSMKSCLFSFSDSLLSFVFELREQGMAVNTSMILMKVAKISRQFCMSKAQLQCRNKAFVLNVEQTPIPSTFNSKTMLEVVGARTVHVRKSTNDTKCTTAAITATASGKMLPLLLVFKGA